MIASRIVLNNHCENEKEIYEYGLQIIINTIFSLGLVLICAVIFKEFINTIVFLICYCTIRIFAGGFHASSNNRCMIIFISGYLVSFVLLKYKVIEFSIISIIILIFIDLCIILWSPVGVPNNPIAPELSIKMKKRASIISLIITFVVLILLYFGYEIGEWGYAGVCWFGIIIIAGKFNNLYKGDYNEKN